MKAKEVIDIHQALSALGSRKFPPRVSYKIARFHAKVKPEYGVIEERRRMLMEQYGRPSPQGIEVPRGTAEWLEWYKADQDLLETEIDLTLPTLDLTPEELGDVEPLILVTLIDYLNVLEEV